MSFFHLFLCLIFLFAPVSSFGFDKIVTEALDKGLAGGIVILVKEDGRIIRQSAYGTAKADSVFDVASLTKIYAATLAVMKLTDDGLLDPSDKVSRFFDEFKEGDKADVTIEHLLRHTSGLPPWLPLYCYDSPVQYLLDTPLESRAGEVRKYSDLGFMVLGMVIEKASGESLGAYLQNSFYTPMGLMHTGFNPIDGLDVVPTYFGRFEADMIRDTECTPPQERILQGEVNDGNAREAFKGTAGHAGLFSDADGIARLTELLAHGGVYESKRYISEATLKRFLTKDKNRQGMGFAMTEASLHAANITPQTFGHLGFTGTSAVYVPEQRLTVIILSNRQINGTDENGKYPDLKPLRQAVFNEAQKSLRATTAHSIEKQIHNGGEQD